MSRRHEHADDHYGARRPAIERQLEGTMFDGTAALARQVPEPPAGVIPETDAVGSARERTRVARLHDANDRPWIDAGKPVAMAVLHAQGSVRAETFRAEARHRRGVLPPETQQRTLSYLTQMFGELCREGWLMKKTRADGSVVKVLSSEERNEQVVYVAGPRLERGERYG